MRIMLAFLTLGVSTACAFDAANSAESAVQAGIPLAESKLIAPFPPQAVFVTYEGKRALVQWKASADQKVVAYDVYRSIKGGRLEKVGRLANAPFVDNLPADGPVTYAVASVDQNDNVSRPRAAEGK